MSAVAERLAVPRALAFPAVWDALAIAWRGVITYRRVPQLLVFSTIQPIVFVLMFRYVFGGAIRIPGTDYVDYLMPGIFVQTSVFGAIATAIGLATDVQSGAGRGCVDHAGNHTNSVGISQGKAAPTLAGKSRTVALSCM